MKKMIYLLSIAILSLGGCATSYQMAAPVADLVRSGLINEPAQASRLEKAMTDGDIANLLDVNVRAKLPTGRGTWPAIWTLGTNIREVGWPTCGEIDIMENVGFNPDTIHANIHTKKYNHVRKTAKGSTIKVSKPYEKFHIYAIEWSEDRIDFFVDKNKYFTFENEKSGQDAWPYDKPQYLILNTAIGGTWGGQKGIDDSIFPQKYYIDYVRVYQKQKTQQPEKKQ